MKFHLESKPPWNDLKDKVGGYIGSPPNKGVDTATAWRKGQRRKNISFGDAADKILDM